MNVTPLHGDRGPGRVPPNNLSAEASLLGAMLLSKEAIDVAAERLTPADFYKPAHGHVFDAITCLHAAGEPSDPVTVAAELARSGLLDAIGGRGLLVELQAGTPAISNAARYTSLVHDCAVLRRLGGVAGEIAELSFSGPHDVADAVDQAEALVFDLAQCRSTDTVGSLSDILDVTLTRIEERFERGDAITGTPTGFADLDELTSGLQPNALYVVGARPSAGKTAFGLCVATHAALDMRRPVLVFSMEMSQVELSTRMLCSDARVDSKRVRSGQLAQKDWDRIAESTGRLADAPVWIDDNPNLSITEIRSKARRLKSKVGDLGLVVVDYVQLMSGRSSAENRQVQVAEISRGLKVLARELECPVMALAQLSRGLEQRADKRPILADLKESGALEQDADVVMFVYRDEMYHPDSADRGTAEIIVAKHRNGPTGMVRLAFLEQYTKFANMSRAS